MKKIELSLASIILTGIYYKRKSENITKVLNPKKFFAFF